MGTCTHQKQLYFSFYLVHRPSRYQIFHREILLKRITYLFCLYNPFFYCLHRCTKFSIVQPRDSNIERKIAGSREECTMIVQECSHLGSSMSLGKYNVKVPWK